MHCPFVLKGDTLIHKSDPLNQHWQHQQPQLPRSITQIWTYSACKDTRKPPPAAAQNKVISQSAFALDSSKAAGPPTSNPIILQLNLVKS
jgi:hypothetical protein